MAGTEKKDDGVLKMKDPGQLSYSDALDHAQQMQKQTQGQSSDALIYSDRVTPDFCQKVKTISSKIGVQPNDLMACMCFETGGEFKAKLYPSSNAVGLIQFTQAAVDELNQRTKIAPTAKTSKTALASMSEVDQLDYVEKYFVIQKEIYKRSMSNLADLYMAIFCPAGVGQSDNYALYKRGTKAYSRNSGLDANKDGIITKAEAASKPMQRLEEGLQELEDRNAPALGAGTIKLKTDPNLKIRSGASKKSTTIGRIPNGASFEYIKEQNGWLRIRYNGKMGWISKQYTSLYGSAPAATTTTTAPQVTETHAQPTVAVEEPKVDAPAQNALDDKLEKDAIAWYSTKKFTPDLIKEIQTEFKVEATGTIDARTVQAIAAWQKSIGKTGKDLDGKFGNTSAGERGNAALAAKIADLLKKKTTTGGGTSGRNNVTANLMTKENVDLAALQEDAAQKGYDVSDTVQAAKYIAKYGMASGPKSQCTRGISMFMQLASYARGKAKSRYYKKSSYAHLFGTGDNDNICSEVSSEYKGTPGTDVTGRRNFDKDIESHLTKDAEYVTFQYDTGSKKSQHIVFKIGSSYYSDFKQGTPSGIKTGDRAKFYTVNYYNR